MCPTLKALMDLEYNLFMITQTATLPEAEFNRLDVQWDKAIRKVRALGGQDLLLWPEPEELPEALRP